MADIPVEYVVDVIASISQPTATTNQTSSAFIADLLDADFASAYQIYTSTTAVLEDFADTSDVYRFAVKAFGGPFPTDRLYVVKYGSSNATPLTPLQAITALVAIDNTPYWVGCDSHSDANVLALAGYLDSIKKLFVTSTQQAGVLVTATDTDIASQLQDLAYDQVVTLWSAVADTQFSEGGIVGCMAGLQAGTSTAEFKTMTGVTPDTLSATQITSLENKNVPFYGTMNGTNVLLNTKVASGQFLDTILFSNWLEAEIKSEIFNLFVSQSALGRKVSMDQAGMGLIRQAINVPIKTGQNNGSISADQLPRISTPNPRDIATATRLNRIVPDIVVEVLYSSAVHKAIPVRLFITL